MRKCKISFVSLFWCLTIAVLLTACGGKVLNVSFVGDPKQYTPREKPAERVFGRHSAVLHNAKYIGSMMIHVGETSITESDSDAINEFASKQAPKHGADFYDYDPWPRYVDASYIAEKSRSSYYLGSEGDYARTKVTTITYERVPASTKAYSVDLYRIDENAPKGCNGPFFADCLAGCFRDYTSIGTNFNLCDLYTVKGYVKKGCSGNEMHPNGVPAIYYLIDCITKEDFTEVRDFDKKVLEDDYKKMELLLNSGLDPNIIPSDQSIRNTPDDRLPRVLRGMKENYPPILNIVKDAITRTNKELVNVQEILKEKEWEKTEARLRAQGKYLRPGTAKGLGVKYYDEGITRKYENLYKLQLDFFTRIDKLLVQKGARVRVEEPKKPDVQRAKEGEPPKRIESSLQPPVRETPSKMAFIPKLNGEITAIKFFEWDQKTVPPQKKRVYSRVFPKTQSRTIYAEVNLSYPAPGYRIDFQMEIVFYRPNGTVLGQNKWNAYILADWTYSNHWAGWGWPSYGTNTWETGTYRIDVYLDGNKIAEESFTVY